MRQYRFTEEDLTHYTESKCRSANSCIYFIAREAVERGMTVTFLSRRSISATVSRARPHYHKVGSVYTITDTQGRKRTFNKTRLLHDVVSPAGFSKSKMSNYLNYPGISAPKGFVISQQASLSELTAYFELNQPSFPLVVKPIGGSMGRGVTVNLNTLHEVHHAIRTLDYDKVRVEEFIQGVEYRVYLVGGKLIAAVKRSPAAIVGDGHNCIAELIQDLNDDKQDLRLPEIKQPVLDQFLENSGSTLSEVPSKGEEINLSEALGRSTGGHISAAIHELTQSQITDIETHVGVPFTKVPCVGVDIIIDSDQTVRVIEVNTRPQLSSAMVPDEGQGVNVARAIIDFLFPAEQEKVKTMPPFRFPKYQKKLINEDVDLSFPPKVPKT